MNLWIDIARDQLVKAIESVDCLILNDAELRQLTGKPNLVSAAREILAWKASRIGRGPSVIVAKQGEYGAALVTSEGFFALPAYPMENVIDPTGAGDTFAGGFVGYIAAHPDQELSDELLRRAMAHGTALASFNVEEFGTERVERLTGEEIHARVEALREITQFSGAPLAAARLRLVPARRRIPRPNLGCGRRLAGALTQRVVPAVGEPTCDRRLYPPPAGYTISSRSGCLDFHLADGVLEDPDRGSLPDRALGCAPDPRGDQGEDGGIGPRSGPLHPHHPRARLPRSPRRGPHGDPQLVPPPRVRTAVARGRLTQR